MIGQRTIYNSEKRRNTKNAVVESMKFNKIKSALSPGSYYFSGDEAVAEGAIAAGCRYYAGYPITPSSEIMERISLRFKDVKGVFMQMEDEIASICSV